MDLDRYDSSDYTQCFLDGFQSFPGQTFGFKDVFWYFTSAEEMAVPNGALHSNNFARKDPSAHSDLEERIIEYLIMDHCLQLVPGCDGVDSVRLPSLWNVPALKSIH